MATKNGLKTVLADLKKGIKSDMAKKEKSDWQLLTDIEKDTIKSQKELKESDKELDLIDMFNQLTD